MHSCLKSKSNFQFKRPKMIGLIPVRKKLGTTYSVF